MVGTVVSLDTAVFRYPFRIRLYDNMVVVMDLHGDDYSCHSFSYPEFHYLSSFCKRGDSPKEQVSIENVRFDGKSIIAIDAAKSELVHFSFDFYRTSFLRNKAVKLDKKILRPLDFAMTDDSTFIFPDYSGENRFCIADSKGKLIGKFGTIPTSNDDVLESSPMALAQAWRSFIDYNPHNGVLAAVTQLGEVLEIYNLKDSTHIVCVGPNGEPKFEVSQGYGVPTGIMGFSDVQVTDSAIYAVFHGTSFKKLAQDANKGIHVDGGKYVYKYSLKGEPLCKYILDYYVNGFSVNEKEAIFLTTDVNKDDPIIKYVLP